MFENLTDRLTKALDRIRGRGRLSAGDVDAVLREIRMALLEADVALPVVKDLVERVRASATGAEVLRSLTPGQAVVGVVHRELVATLGTPVPLEVRAKPPAVVLLAGLQGAGKTTTAAKLARWLVEKRRKRVMLASVDVYRPAAIAQLSTLAGEIDVPFARGDSNEVVIRAAQALAAARDVSAEILVVDTAGRTAVDEAMMDEIQALHRGLVPAATLFVVDAMAGQDAAKAARAFHERLPLTGIVLSKADGDARGGAALSVRAVTGAPLMFLGTGEKSAALEVFDPNRLARRILGMGDVVGLVETAEAAAQVDAGRPAARAGSGSFTLEDFRDQMRQMGALGGIGALMEHLPAHMAGPAGAAAGGDRMLRRFGAIIDSMTPGERSDPGVIKASRKRRIAAGSGTSVQEVNHMLKRFNDARTLMKRMGRGGGLGKLLKGLGRRRS